LPILYVSGFSKNKACYWKNSELVELEGNKGAAGLSIFEQDGDIYIAGAVKNKPCYWKNGQITIFQKRKGYATSVTVNDDDVYVFGNIFIKQKYNTFLWHNNELKILKSD